MDSPQVLTIMSQLQQMLDGAKHTQNQLSNIGQQITSHGTQLKLIQTQTQEQLTGFTTHLKQTQEQIAAQDAHIKQLQTQTQTQLATLATQVEQLTRRLNSVERLSPLMLSGSDSNGIGPGGVGSSVPLAAIPVVAPLPPPIIPSSDSGRGRPRKNIRTLGFRKFEPPTGWIQISNHFLIICGVSTNLSNDILKSMLF